MKRTTAQAATGAFGAALLTLLLVLPAAGQSVPTTLNYQGRLLQNTSAQDAVTGTVDIVFSIWSGPASDVAAVELWSESWTGVALSNGIFSVLLGSNGSPLDPADFQGDDSLFLQLEIDGEVLLPRQQLGSAPFAIVDEPANELQDLELTGNTLGLSGSAATVDLSSYLDDSDEQDLSLSGTTLSLTHDATPVDLSGFLDDTDSQTLGLSGTTLSISGSGSSVNLSSFLDDTDSQTLGLSGTTLSISGSGSSVNLAGFLDNTDSQGLASVLAFGSTGGGRDIRDVDVVEASSFVGHALDCPDCVSANDIAQDTILGNDVNDNIYILHVDCNGECNDMSMVQACNVIENLRGLSVHVELIGVSCVHDIPSSSVNGFVPCNDGSQDIGDNECRAFNLRTLADLPCIDGAGTDALVTCLLTDIPR